MIHDHGFNFDTELFLDLNSPWSLGWDHFFYLMSGRIIWIPLYLFILLIIYRRWGWKTMVASLIFIGLSVILVDQFCNVFKSGFEKLRPTHNPHIQHLVHTVNDYRGGRFGTFSAHAATTSCIATLSALIIRRKIFSILISLWVLIVSYSRIYLGVHFPLDIACGMAAGMLTALIFFVLFRLRQLRKFYHPPYSLMRFRPPGILKRIFPGMIWNFPDHREVFLTFDDGPTPEVTPWVLDQLARYQFKATFFCLGKNVEQHPKIFQRILEQGHAVGNHTYSHQKGWEMKTWRYIEDIDFADDLIHSNLLRPPYGRITPIQAKLLSERYNLIMWSVLSQDYSSLISPRKCLRSVIKYVDHGSIVLFHDSHKAFRNLRYALPRVLDFLYEHGYGCAKIEL